GLATGRSGSLLVWTALQDPVIYELSAKVPDLAGNVAHVKARFRGSSTIDTVLPRIISVRPTPGQTNYQADEIVFEFSKPMDTLASVRFSAVPSEFELQLEPRWDPGWQRLRLMRPAVRPGDDPPVAPGSQDSSIVAGRGTQTWSLSAHHVVLFAGLPDLEGNDTRHPAATSFSRDSTFAGEDVRGRVLGSGPSIVCLRSGVAVALAVTDDSGWFASRVPAGRYEVVAFSDTSRNGLADLVGRVEADLPGSDTILIRIEPEPTPRALSEYCR
ncbi:MAG: hypothetical protein R6X13_01315, partial [bacterium]